MNDFDYEAMQDAKDSAYWQESDERNEYVEAINSSHEFAAE